MPVIQRGQRTGEQEAITALTKELRHLLNLYRIDVAIIVFVQQVDEVTVDAIREQVAFFVTACPFGFGRIVDTRFEHRAQCDIVCKLGIVEDGR